MQKNNVRLAGNIGEVKYVEAVDGKKSRIEIAVAQNIDIMDSEEQKTNWHSVVAFGENADVINKYIHKVGSLFIKRSRLGYSDFVVSDDTKYNKPNIVINHHMDLRANTFKPTEEGVKNSSVLSLGEVEIAGTLGRLKMEKVKGQTILRFGVAINFKNEETGEEKTVWHNFVSFGETATKLFEKLKDAKKVFVETEMDYYKKEYKDSESGDDRSVKLANLVVRYPGQVSIKI